MKNLIVRPGGLGDVILSAITVSSIKKKYPLDSFNTVVLQDYEYVADLFGVYDKIYTIPNFYYYGNQNGQVYKRFKEELNYDYDHILNWQDEYIELFSDKNQIPRVEMFLKNSPYKNINININDSKYIFRRNLHKEKHDKKTIGLCMISPSLYRSFNEDKIIDIAYKLLKQDYKVVHFGFRKLTEKIQHDNFEDLGCNVLPEDLFKIINDLDLLITVDTAAFHIATLVDTPYLAFFGEINAKLRTTHLGKVNGKIFCNDDLECVSGDCHFCPERACLNDYKVDDITDGVYKYL